MVYNGPSEAGLVREAHGKGAEREENQNRRNHEAFS